MVEKQMMIYERAVPVSKERHAGWSVEVGGDYGFAKELNLAPLLTTEFANALREYPIVFSETNGTIVPAAALGLRDAENLFVTAENGWDARYVPAFIRRYPFVFSHDVAKGTLTLCIDEGFSEFNQDGKGRPLFDEEGQPSEYLRRMLGFTQTYQREFQVTRAFCERLKSLEILTPGSIKFQSRGGATITTGGLLMVEKEKLQAISDEKLPELFESGDLETIYAHVFSLGNLDTLGKRLNARASDGQT